MFSSLPVELLRTILNYLDGKSVGRCGETNHALFALSKTIPSYWRDYAIFLWPHLRATEDSEPYGGSWEALVKDKNRLNRSAAMAYYCSGDRKGFHRGRTGNFDLSPDKGVHQFHVRFHQKTVWVTFDRQPESDEPLRVKYKIWLQNDQEPRSTMLHDWTIQTLKMDEVFFFDNVFGTKDPSEYVSGQGKISFQFAVTLLNR